MLASGQASRTRNPGISKATGRDDTAKCAKGMETQGRLQGGWQRLAGPCGNRAEHRSRRAPVADRADTAHCIVPLVGSVAIPRATALRGRLPGYGMRCPVC